MAKKSKEQKQLKSLKRSVTMLHLTCNEIQSHTEMIYDKLHEEKARVKLPKISLDQARKYSLIAITICSFLATIKYIIS